MIYLESQLKVVDNSGAKWAKCISIKKNGKHPSATVGMLILVSLKKFSSRKKVNKRIIYVGLIIGVSYWISRLDGSLIKFFSNRLLLFNKQFKFLGTRIYGSILKEIRIKNLTEKKNKKYFQKIFSYSSSAL
jgi:large subunit ribosomal protein L14